ncbi:ribbon-helix-helix domain-containing protein [Litorimonas haliclonae]|uniref:ribbon-helix-helix domain-containing protein n=1 Tax=Litorimonas haliclonae TaxID=2081977 RepID=UPI0039EE4EA2
MSLKKRSVSLYGHQTSLALEEEFWAVIDAHLKNSGQSFARFIRELDDKRLEETSNQNLASYLRVWVLKSVMTEQ